MRRALLFIPLLLLLALPSAAQAGELVLEPIRTAIRRHIADKNQASATDIRVKYSLPDRYIFYPAQFPEDIKAKAREFYTTFYHVTPTQAQIDGLFAGGA